MLTGKRAAAAHLYFLSGAVRFGEFELSVHRDNPDLPKSPIYLHYPKAGALGSGYLDGLHRLLGDLLAELLRAEEIKWDYLAAVPRGALPLGERMFQSLLHPELGVRTIAPRLLQFGKEEHPGGGTVFTAPEGRLEPGAQLVIVEDHTSGGRNKKLIRAAAEAAGLVVRDMLTIVDRQQGGVQAMAHEGVRLHALYTLDELLDFGLEQMYIDTDTAERVRAYIRENQLWTLSSDPPVIL